MTEAKPRVVLTRRWPERIEAQMGEQFDLVINTDDHPMSAGELRHALETADAVCPTVTDRLDQAVFNGCRPRARIMANFGTGYNHIDLSAAAAAGIAVTNTPDVLTDATADLAILLLLMVTRRAREGANEIANNSWAGWRPTHLMGAGLNGKTLGIVGMGRIGQAVARRAHLGFGMHIVYSSRSPVTPSIAGALKAEHLNLERLLVRADVVSLHCPSTEQTRGLIGADALRTMGTSAFLINTARGDLVDEEALTDALVCGTIAGAGLDVFAGEPQMSDRLRRQPNAALLPHLGSATLETREAMGLRACDNLAAHFAGQPLPDPVHP